MPKQNYVIVGTEITVPKYELSYDAGAPVISEIGGVEVARLNPVAGLDQFLPPGFLTVETIGKMTTALSEKPITDVGDVSVLQEIVRFCLSFANIEGSDDPHSAAEAQAILDSTNVEIRYETRTDVAGTDQNSRILVIPADGTLDDKAETLGAGGINTNILPPLFYPVDRNIMVAHLRDQIVGYVEGFFASPAGAPHLAARPALIEHVNKAIDTDTFVGNPAAIQAQILGDALRSYHRSVGIYVTNMCR